MNNRLLTETKTTSASTDTTTYFYDPNGNQLSSKNESITGEAGTAEYALEEGIADSQLNHYNGFNQLTSVETEDGLISYTYFSSGLRASKTVDETQIDFVLDGGNVVLELTDGTATAKYVRGINLISSTIGAMTSYYLYNGHGDVVQLTNSSGTVIKNYAYDAFGVEQNIDDNDTNPFRYCGEYYDLSSGTYYLRARYYDPTIGRFLSEDTYRGKATDPLSLNLYTYCSNNPIRLIDPSGMTAVKIRDVVEALGGTVSYESTTKTATVSIGNTTDIIYTVGVNGVYINKEGRMMVDDSLFKDDFSCNYFVVDDSEGYTAFQGSITQSYTKDRQAVVTLYEGLGLTIKNNDAGEALAKNENFHNTAAAFLVGAAATGPLLGTGWVLWSGANVTTGTVANAAIGAYFGLSGSPQVRAGDTILSTIITTFVGPGPTMTYIKIYDSNRNPLE